MVGEASTPPWTRTQNCAPRAQQDASSHSAPTFAARRPVAFRSPHLIQGEIAQSGPHRMNTPSRRLRPVHHRPLAVSRTALDNNTSEGEGGFWRSGTLGSGLVDSFSVALLSLRGQVQLQAQQGGEKELLPTNSDHRFGPYPLGWIRAKTLSERTYSSAVVDITSLL